MRSPSVKPRALSLLDLPEDAHLIIVRQLDARDLARYTECTSRALTALLAGHTEVWQVWADLRERLLTVRDPPGAQLDAREADGLNKSRYVRSWASLNSRCAQCGKQGVPSMLPTGADGQPLTTTPAADDQSRYMHLCNWLIRKMS